MRVLNWGSPAAIRAALAEERFHVLHISCHARPGALILESDTGTAEKVDASGSSATSSSPTRGCRWSCWPGAPPRWAPTAATSSRGARRPEAKVVRGAGAARAGPRPAARRGARGAGDDCPGHRPLRHRPGRRAVRGAGPRDPNQTPLAECPPAGGWKTSSPHPAAREDPRGCGPSGPPPCCPGRPRPAAVPPHRRTGGTDRRHAADRAAVAARGDDPPGRGLRRPPPRTPAFLRAAPRGAGVVLHGIGGMGKSSLAVEIIDHLEREAGLVVLIEPAHSGRPDPRRHPAPTLALSCPRQAGPRCTHSSPGRRPADRRDTTVEQRLALLQQVVLPRCRSCCCSTTPKTCSPPPTTPSGS